MDFDKLIQDLLNQGVSIEEMGKQFADAANRVEAANNSKKKRDKYIYDLREAAFRAFDHASDSFEVAAIFATLAAANRYPDMELKQLEEYQDATCKALQETAKLQYDLGNEPEDIVGTLLNALFTPFDKEDKDESDDAKIARFLRKLG